MEELDIKQIIKNIYQRRNIFIYILLIAIVIGILYTFIIKRPIYKVTSQILIDKTDASIEEFIQSRDVLNSKEITANFNKTSKLITITTQANKADKAFNTTNQYIENLQTKLEEVYGIKVFKTIETPQLPQKAINTTYIKDILISALIGIVVYAIYIVLMLNINGTITSSEIENQIGLKVLGQVSLEKSKDKKQTIFYDSKNKNIMNQLKRIEANIELNKENRNPKTIMLTANRKGSGNSYITNNLAMQYAKLYNKVLIIDANIINKTLTSLYNKKEVLGLVDVIKKNEGKVIEQYVTKTEKENIYLLPVGKEIIGEELFLTESINTILEELKKNYDIILIDTESINEYMYPIKLSEISDTNIIVANACKTKLEEIIRAKTTIENVGGKVSGVIINKVL